MYSASGLLLNTVEARKTASEGTKALLLGLSHGRLPVLGGNCHRREEDVQERRITARKQLIAECTSTQG